jgi:uncharacterized protein YndB with AHSA1/START domain
MKDPDCREIIVEDVFAHTPAAIWQALTTGDLMARWLRMPLSNFEPVVGNRFTYQTTPAGEWNGIIACEVLAVVPQQRFVYSWTGGHAANTGYGAKLDTIVTFTLAAVPGGTRLRLVHSGFVLPRNDMAFKTMSGGWAKVVPNIAAIAGETDREKPH